MIGDGWDAEPATRPGEFEPDPRDARRRRVMVVTGSRAEFGLLRPVMDAVRDHHALELLVVAAGAHLIPPAETFREVKNAYPVADSIPMQKPGPATRLDDAEALGRGIARLARSLASLRPDWVVLLGDRIEAFAAAAASVAGVAVAHLHGGDRAEGIADEAIRHAVTKLAHLHLAATQASAERILRMGEKPEHVRVIGSPAIDAIDDTPPLPDAQWHALGPPDAVMLLHPLARHPEEEEAAASEVIRGTLESLPRHARLVALAPNADPGREGIERAIGAFESAGRLRRAPHMARGQFVGLLKRLASTRGVLVGNSSAGLIEAAAIRLPVVNVGPRQNGRERAGNVVDSPRESAETVAHALRRAVALDLANLRHPYGEGRAGPLAAAALAETDPHSPAILRKRNTY